MRWRRADPPAGEGGFTLIEMLVVLSIAGLVAAMVFDSAALGVRDNFARADRDVRAIDHAIGETVFRRLLRDAESLRGDARHIDLIAAAAPPPGCVARDNVVHLKLIVAGGGGALECSGHNPSRAPLAAWANGAATFAYSSDGAVWSDRWPPSRRRRGDAEPARPLVKISFPRVRGASPAWVARAGAGG